MVEILVRFADCVLHISLHRSVLLVWFCWGRCGRFRFQSFRRRLRGFAGLRRFTGLCSGCITFSQLGHTTLGFDQFLPPTSPDIQISVLLNETIETPMASCQPFSPSLLGVFFRLALFHLPKSMEQL